MQSRLVVDSGVKTLVPFPEEPRHTRKRPFLWYTVKLCANVMVRLQSEQQRGELELESRLDGAWRRVAEGRRRVVQGVSPRGGGRL